METGIFEWTHDGAQLRTSYDVIGCGRPALLLPALSSISTRREMHPLAEHLAGDCRCIIPDWPGYGLDAPAGGRPPELTPNLMLSFLRAFVASEIKSPALAIGAGHSAAYLLTVASEMPDRFSRIALVAPTWRGPLPTAMGEHRRPLWHKLRKAVDAPIVGPALFRLNVSRPVIRKMMRAHVYGDEAFVTPERLEEKVAVTRRRGARFATAAFVTGEMDLVREQGDFLRLLEWPALAPVLLLIGSQTPRRSRAEMDAAADVPRIASQIVPGSLAAHEEHPQPVADAILRFAAATATIRQAPVRVAPAQMPELQSGVSAADRDIEVRTEDRAPNPKAGARTEDRPAKQKDGTRAGQIARAAKKSERAAAMRRLRTN
jgi:pimeloyl-ACP methyl ester carboxylesterase